MPADIIRPDVFDRRASQLLPGGGDGGHDGGMPPDFPERVAVLETEVKHIKTDVATLKTDVRQMAADITTLKVDVATIKERLQHLPTKGWGVGAVVTTVGLIAALVALAPKLQAWLGTAPH